MLQQTIAIFLVLGLLFAALWLLKRQGMASFKLTAKTKGTKMRVIERIVLTQHHSLHLVSIENHLVVFAASPTGCHPVDRSVLPFDSLPAETAAGSRREAASC